MQEKRQKCYMDRVQNHAEPQEKRKSKNNLILHLMSVIKRIYSYMGKARASPRGGYCPSAVSMFPTLPVRGPQNHKTYENISYYFCDFCPEGRQPCVICYQSNVHFLLKCTPSNKLLLVLASSCSSRLHLFSLIS